jgi:hypothetical protein
MREAAIENRIEERTQMRILTPDPRPALWKPIHHAHAVDRLAVLHFFDERNTTVHFMVQ